MLPICLNTVFKNCTRIGKLILRKITKIVATRCHVLKLKCTKFYFGWGSAPDPAGGAYSSPPDALAGLSRPTSRRREGRKDGGKDKEGREGDLHIRGGGSKGRMKRGKK